MTGVQTCALPIWKGEVEDVEADSQEEALVEDPTCSQSSQGDPRRSGRRRSRPLLPGDDPDNVEEKEKPAKKGKGKSQTDSQSTTPVAADSQSQGRSTRRSKLAVEVVEAGKPQKKAALKDGSQSSQTLIQTCSISYRLHHLLTTYCRPLLGICLNMQGDRKSTRLNSSH